METLQEHEVKLTSQQLRVIAYALRRLISENKQYDDFASVLTVEIAEETITRLNLKTI